MSRTLLPGMLFIACASGPRPVPSGLTPAERLTFCEVVTQHAKAVATFEIDSKGAHDSHFTGTLELTGTNALSLTTEGTFDKQAVHVEFSSMSGDITRTVTKGPSASAQKNASQPALNEALTVALVRMGLLHNLAMLVDDKMVAKAEGGIREEIQAVDVHDAGPDAVAAEPCRRVDYALQMGGQRVAETSLCIADATGLPLQRRITVHFPEGDMTDTERFSWKVK